MASNDQWPPVAATGRNSGKNRSSINIKKPTKEHQQQVLTGLTEMFQSTLESEVILSVAHSCDWDLQACIDALIAISSTVESENKLIQNNESFVLVTSNDSDKYKKLFTDEVKPDFVKMNKDELQLQQDELKRFEKLKKKSTKNRMGSFRGNISKLNSTTTNEIKQESQEPVSFDSIWDLPVSQSMNGENNSNNDKFDVNNQQYLLPTMPQPPNPWTSDFSKVAWAHQSSKNLHPPDTPTGELNETQFLSHSNQLNKTRNESEFCGLKVQYRTAGMESSSDDDDADVVIEEELNCTIPTSLPVNVSQLLSSSIQSPPRVSNTQKTTTITTASPPRTPKRSIHQLTLGRIKESINNGEKILIIMRGLPGSGKSYLARSLITNNSDNDPFHHIFSTDDYFVALGRGVYKYDPRKLDDAHSNNQKRVFDALKQGRTPVIVDNTNLQAWEMRPYAAMAVKHGYIVEILESDAPWTQNINELTRKNSHGVPKERIRQMSSKYEHGITGTWLLDHFSLKYEPGHEPKKRSDLEKGDRVGSPIAENVAVPQASKNDAEEVASNPEISSRSGSAFVDYQREIKSPDSMKNDEKTPETSEKMSSKISPAEKYILQALGAIGSERKGSLAPEIVSPISEKEDTSSDNNENNSSQGWDSSLLNDNEPSNNCSDKSPVSLAEIQRQDEEFGKEIRREEEKSTPTSEEEDDGMRNAVHDFLNELAQGYTESDCITEVLPVVQQRQSTVIITEVFEEAKKESISTVPESNQVILADINDANNDKIVENTDTTGDNINLETDIKEQEEEKEVIEDEQVENISVEDKDLSFIDAGNLLDIETAEEPKEPIQSTSTLGTIFKIIKTSILGNSFDDENSELKANEIEQGKELKELAQPLEDKKTKEISSETPEALVTDNINVIENPIAEIRAAINSTDSGIITTEMTDNDKIDESEFHSMENESIEGEKNSFISVLDSSGSFSNKQPENIGESSLLQESNSPSIAEGSKKFEILDNINRITWRESPFPVDDLTLPKVNLVDEEIGKNIPKSDAETNTTYYDFNVLYIGGTSDPTYKVVQASNRHINEGLTLQKSERPPLKLMLDKSSMTGDVFTREGNTELENEEEKKNRIPELMELFPHIPRDYLIEIFEKVKEDFDWAVELLLEVNPDDVSMKFPEGKIKEEDFVLEEEKDEDVFIGLEQSNATCTDSTPVFSLVAPEYLEEEEDDEEEEEETEKSVNDELNGETTFPDTKLLKEIKTDISDDTCSASTASASRTESTEDEKSSESDELLELNLGFDFIKALERQFSYPDFHIPDGFVPVVQIKKSIAEELHACWIESMYQQLNARHEQLDQMIAKDAEYARSLERQLELEEARECEKSPEPNLNQIMDMELALAKYRNELKSMIARETPDDLAARLSRQMLHESLPDIDPDTFNEILKAHNGNFKEAFEVIEINTGKSIVPCDTLKKQKILMEKAKEEDGNLKERQPPIIVVRDETKDEKASYKAAVAHARDSRHEAQRQFSLKVQNYNKAAEAYRKGYPQVAAYYSQMARLHSRKIDAAHAAAASAFVEAQSWDDEETLDLHNLFVSEALVALDEFLEYHSNKLMRSNKRASSVYIITGRGARSNNRTSKIKPAVSQRLNSKNIKFSEANPGCLKVTLYRKNGTTD